MKSLDDLIDLSGRRALVTGGTGHLGIAVCETLIELGAQVAVLDRDRRACETRAAELSVIRPGGAFSMPCDLADESATRKATKEAVASMGGLDIFVHCAGYVGTTSAPGWVAPFEKQTVEAWDAAMRVNLTAAFIIAQEAKSALESSVGGSVILFGSIYGVVAPDFRLYEGTEMGTPAGYAASKGGLVQLTRYLASALAPRVRVNALSPGGVLRGQPDAFRERYTKRTPLRRMAVEADVKGAVAFLAGDLSAYVTGQNLLVDGGWTAW